MVERKCVKGYRLVQHCDGAMRFKQVRTSHVIMHCGRTCCQCMHGSGY